MHLFVGKYSCDENVIGVELEAMLACKRCNVFLLSVHCRRHNVTYYIITITVYKSYLFRQMYV